MSGGKLPVPANEASAGAGILGMIARSALSPR